jgi:hypothetical protein
MKSEVVVVVINWNLKHKTSQCLRTVMASDVPSDILVVDNGSQDNSVSYLRETFPQVEMITLPENIGFSAACNRAVELILRTTPCKYVFFLNNDAVVHPHTLSLLLEEARAYPEAGIIGPKIYYAGSFKKIWYAGAVRRKGVLAAARTGRDRIDRGQFDHRHTVDYVFGAAMLVRRQVFEMIGCFDENFFLYLEDMDFCLRAKEAGFSLRFVPQALVWHDGSASTVNHLPMRRYHFVRSTLYFARKHTAWWWLLPSLGYWGLVFLRFALVDVFQGNTRSLQAYFEGLWQGLFHDRSGELCEQEVYPIQSVQQ